MFFLHVGHKIAEILYKNYGIIQKRKYLSINIYSVIYCIRAAKQNCNYIKSKLKSSSKFKANHKKNFSEKCHNLEDD